MSEEALSDSDLEASIDSEGDYLENMEEEDDEEEMDEDENDGDDEDESVGEFIFSGHGS